MFLQFWKHIALSCCYTVLSMIYGFRLYHVDDIPSGMGGDALDFNKATAVGWMHAVRVIC